MFSEAVIPRLSVPVVNIFKFVIINLLLWPLLEYLYSVLGKNEARQAIMKGECIYWTDHKAGPFLLHGKSYNRRSKCVVLAVGIFAILTSFSLEFAFDSKTVTESETKNVLSGINAFDIQAAEDNRTMDINIEAVLLSSVRVLEVSGHTGVSIPFSEQHTIRYDKETRYRGKRLQYNSDAMWAEVTVPGSPLKLDEQYRPVYDPMVTKKSYFIENVNVTLLGEGNESERSINRIESNITVEPREVVNFTPRHGTSVKIFLDAEGDIIICGAAIGKALIIHFEGKDTQLWLATAMDSQEYQKSITKTAGDRLVVSASLVAVLHSKDKDINDLPIDINSAVILSGSIKLEWLLSTANNYVLPPLVNELVFEAVGASMFQSIPNSKFKEKGTFNTKSVVRTALKIHVLIPARALFIIIFIGCILRLSFLKWRYSKIAMNNLNEKEVVIGNDFDYAVRLFSSQMDGRLDCYNPARTQWGLGIRRGEDDIDHVEISDSPTEPYLKELCGLVKKIT